MYINEQTEDQDIERVELDEETKLRIEQLNRLQQGELAVVPATEEPTEANWNRHELRGKRHNQGRRHGVYGLRGSKVFVPGQKIAPDSLLTIVGPGFKNRWGDYTWAEILCRCRCGKEITVSYPAAAHGKFSCGCERRPYTKSRGTPPEIAEPLMEAVGKSIIIDPRPDPYVGLRLTNPQSQVEVIVVGPNESAPPFYHRGQTLVYWDCACTGCAALETIIVRPGKLQQQDLLLALYKWAGDHQCVAL